MPIHAWDVASSEATHLSIAKRMAHAGPAEMLASGDGAPK
jgi:hypothetical protein